MEIFGLLLGLLLALLVLFFGVAHPIWMIIDAGLSERSTGAKVVWIIVMFVTWTFGSVLYGIFAAKQIFVKIISVVGALGIVAFIGALFVGFEMAQPFLQAAPETIAAELSNVQHPDVSEVEMEELKENIKGLFSETPFSFSTFAESPERFQVNMLLLHRLSMFTTDRVLSREEFTEWQRLYETRESLSAEQLGMEIANQ